MTLNLVLFVIFFLMVLGTLSLFGHGDWRWSAGIAAVLVIAVRYAVTGAIKSLFLLPFKAKSAVLKGATAQLHAICLVEKPQAEMVAQSPTDNAAEEEAQAGDDTPRHYFLIDVTITPRPSNGKFQHWEPGELMLVPFAAKISPDSQEYDSLSVLSKIEVWQDNAFVADEGYKYNGTQRLRLIFGVQPGHQQLKFRYYFESFGQLNLPSPIAAAQ